MDNEVLNLNRFEAIQPYQDHEIPAAVKRVAQSSYFKQIVAYAFPQIDFENFKQKFLQIQTVRQFQKEFTDQVIRHILSTTSTQLTSEGFQNLTSNHPAMFVANHRDILLDAAIFQILLDEHHLETSEITFGDNLMQGDLVIDLGKMNKMFKIVRGGSVHDFYVNSKEVSAYMRYTIVHQKNGVWIAQRNGRTKNGDDKTEPAVLKMWSMSSKKSFVENMLELNITPIVISYEFEPCDFLKTQELWISKSQKYIKKEGEDLQSILRGIMQPKGRIHIEVGESISELDLQKCDRAEKNAKFQLLAQLIDQRIYAHYKLWPNHYIAYDILNRTNQFASYYSATEKATFEIYMNTGLQTLVGNIEELKTLFLGIYANPVSNFINYQRK